MVTKVIGDWNEFIADLIVGGANSLQIGEVLIQWGDITGVAGGQGAITFPIAYTTIPVVIISLHNAALGSQTGYSMYPNLILTDRFEAQSREILDTGVGVTDVNDRNVDMRWFAIGINNA